MPFLNKSRLRPPRPETATRRPPAPTVRPALSSNMDEQAAAPAVGYLRRIRAWLLRPRIKLSIAAVIAILGLLDVLFGHPVQGILFLIWSPVMVWEVRKGTPGAREWWPGGPRM